MLKNKYGRIFIFLLSTVYCLLFTSTDVFSAKEEEDLFAAEAAFEDGSYEISLGLLEGFIKDYPGSELIPKANLLIGKCLFYEEKYLKAMTKFEELLTSGGERSRTIRDVVLYWIAEVHFKKKDYRQARVYYQKLIVEFPRSSYAAFALYSLGWSLFEEERFEQARSVLRKLKQKFPMHKLEPDADFKIALCFYNLKKYAQAEEHFDAYVKNYPDSQTLAEALFYRAECLYYLGDFERAKSSYLGVIERVYSVGDLLDGKAGKIPKLPVVSNGGSNNKLADLAYVGLGWVYVKLKKYSQAENVFNKVKAKYGEIYASVLFAKAEIFKEKQNFELALRLYSQLIDKFPRHESIFFACFGKAESLYSLLRYEEAISVYKDILAQAAGCDNKDKPDLIELIDKVHYNLAWAYLKMGDFSSAISEFQKVAESSDDQIVKISALCQVGDAYQDLGEYQKAIDAYDKILRDYPDSLYSDYVQYRVSLCLLKMGRFENAILGLKSMKVNFPDSRLKDEAEYYIGVVYFQKQDFDNARDQLDRFVRVFTDSPLREQGLYLKAVSLFNLGRYEEAQGGFEQLIKEYPQNLDLVIKCNFEIASCFYQNGKKQAGVKKFKEILSRYPDSNIAPEVIYFLGEHYSREGNQDVAIRYFRRLICDYHDSGIVGDAYYSLGWIYFSQDKYEDALIQFDNICRIPKSQLKTQAILAIGDVYFKEGNLDEALKHYRQVLTNSPDFSKEASIKAADIYRRLKKYDESIDAYEHALNKSSRDEWPQIQFKIAESFEECGKVNEAIEAYFKNIYLYPQDKYWLLRSYLRLARIFENKEDWSEAKNIYTRVLDLDVDEAKFARERLDWIRKQSIVGSP